MANNDIHAFDCYLQSPSFSIYNTTLSSRGRHFRTNNTSNCDNTKSAVPGLLETAIFTIDSVSPRFNVQTPKDQRALRGYRSLS